MNEIIKARQLSTHPTFYRVEHDGVDSGELLKEHEADGDEHRLEVLLAKDVRQLEPALLRHLHRQLDVLQQSGDSRNFLSRVI